MLSPKMLFLKQLSDFKCSANWSANEGANNY